MKRKTAARLIVVGVCWTALLAFRAVYVEPRAAAAACLAAASLPCTLRTALLWLQYQELWGAAALALGLLAFFTRLPLAVAAVVAGIAAIVNFNASWGMAGAALGAWAWLMPAAEATAASPGSARTPSSQGSGY